MIPTEVSPACVDVAATNPAEGSRLQAVDAFGAVRRFREILRNDPGSQEAKRSAAKLLAQLGQSGEYVNIFREEGAFSADCLAWIRTLIWDSLRSHDLVLAGQIAELLAQVVWGSRWYPATTNSFAHSKRWREARTLTIPKLKHDIDQFKYLRSHGAIGAEFDAVIKKYHTMIERLDSLGHGAKLPLDGDEFASSLIGDVYNRIVYKRQTPRVSRALSNMWNPSLVEQQYLGAPPGVAVIDDFLTAEALIEIRLFCLESTVWSTNRYERGRLGAFFADGFNCPLLLQIAEELSALLPHVIGNHYPLEQLWGFKQDENCSVPSATHADFAAVNVNFWITPDYSNTDSETGGLIIFDVDAPLRWGFQVYNDCSDRIAPFLKRHGAKSLSVPYRANRAVIFNSDLFHCTDAFTFLPGYENRRINITLLYGKREHDIHHPTIARQDEILADRVDRPANAWRSASFSRLRSRR